MRTQPAHTMANPVCMKKTRIAAKIKKKVSTELVTLSIPAFTAASRVLEMHSMSSLVEFPPSLTRHAWYVLPPDILI